MDQQIKELRESTAGSGVDVTEVDGGEAILVNLPDGVTFDVGSATLKPGFRSTLDDVADTCVLPALRHLGVRRLDRIFVSHANADHYGGVSGILNVHPTAHLHLSPHFEAHAGQSAAGRSAPVFRERFRGWVAPVPGQNSA